MTIFSKNSYNNKLGVPISLTNLDLNTNFGVFEIGMDRKGEIDYLSRLISPDIGVITNISYAHAKNFNTLFDIAQAKSEIINNIKSGGTIVLNKDDRFFNFFYNLATKKKLKIISFGKNKNSNISLLNIKKHKKNSILIFKVNSKVYNFKVKNSLLPYINNILASCSAEKFRNY